jgi:hypothetical protein
MDARPDCMTKYKICCSVFAAATPFVAFPRIEWDGGKRRVGWWGFVVDHSHLMTECV